METEQSGSIDQQQIQQLTSVFRGLKKRVTVPNPKIVSIGHGFLGAHEASALRQPQLFPQSTFEGYDNGLMAAAVSNINKDDFQLDSSVTLSPSDAIEALREKPAESIDIIIARNPNPNEGLTSEEGLSAAVRALAKRGVMLITTEDENEGNRILANVLTVLKLDQGINLKTLIETESGVTGIHEGKTVRLELEDIDRNGPSLVFSDKFAIFLSESGQ